LRNLEITIIVGLWSVLYRIFPFTSRRIWWVA